MSMIDDNNVNIILFKDLSITDEEKGFVESILGIDNSAHNTTVMQRKVAISVLFLAKQIEASSKSNDKNAKRMFCLTLVIGLLGTVQLVELILKLLGK